VSPRRAVGKGHLVTGAFLDPEAVPADLHRRAARVLVVGADGRVLVERVRVATDPVQGSWWELPGGGLEPGESTATAAARELAEETGYLDVAVGPPIATRRARYRGPSRVAEQHETFHLARLRSDRRAPLAMAAVEAAGLLEVAWLTAAELADGRRVEPQELPALVRQIVDGIVVPRRLADVDLRGWSDAAPQPERLTDGAGVHVVDGRVVRDAAPWTDAVHAWLAHCHDRGVADVPVPLGVDVHGREAVTFVGGAVTLEAGAASGASADALPPGWWPEPLRTTEGVAEVGRLLARLRDVSRDASRGAGALADQVWRVGVTTRPADGEVICHGDVGHANLVWQLGGQPALIDWEFAHPGPPLRDLAEAACWLVPLVAFDHERRGFAAAPDRRARLRALAAAGRADVTSLLAAVDHYLDTEIARVRRFGGYGIAPWNDFLAADQPAGFERVRTYLAAHGLGG
jgi:8-oxo-dGTP pyrophosphatase MutT (NUDIX family)